MTTGIGGLKTWSLKENRHQKLKVNILLSVCTNVSVSSGVILGVWQAGNGTRVYQSLSNSAKVAFVMVIASLLKVELNKIPKGNNTDANRNTGKKL